MAAGFTRAVRSRRPKAVHSSGSVNVYADDRAIRSAGSTRASPGRRTGGTASGWIVPSCHDEAEVAPAQGHRDVRDAPGRAGDQVGVDADHGLPARPHGHLGRHRLSRRLPEDPAPGAAARVRSRVVPVPLHALRDVDVVDLRADEPGQRRGGAQGGGGVAGRRT